MEFTEIARDLKVIRQTMESSLRYTNIPPAAHFAAGGAGLFGSWGTSIILGKEKVSNTHLIASEDLFLLVSLWVAVFLTALGAAIFFSRRQARRQQISAWNSLAARMFLSQVPLVMITAILTIGVTFKGYYDIIPALWLGLYGVILFSFSYFTGRQHRIEALTFMGISVPALFVSGPMALFLLGMGFGGVHILGGIVRWLKQRGKAHESG